MQKRIFIVFLTLAIALSGLHTVYAAKQFNATETSTGIISVSSTDIMTGKIIYTIYRDSEIVNIGEVTVQGLTSTEIGLPVNKLPSDKYEVTVAYYNASNEKISEDTLKISMGTSNPIASDKSVSSAYIASNPIETMKAIMVPYAKVYSNSSLTGNAVVELKRHDIVRIKSISNGIAYISYTIQSGNGTITKDDDVNATYQSNDDLTGIGYISAEAFELEELSYESDLQREAVELAYSRLGTKGVYSQARRYIDYYLDCAAMVCWCWHQVGVDIYNGSYTSCNGIADWAEGQTDNVILWAATEDYLAVQMEWASIKEAHDLGGTTMTLGSSTNYGNFTENEVLDYIDSISRDVWESLEPGDIIFFNKQESLSYTHLHESSDGSTYYCTIDLGTHYVNEGGSNAGYDHVAMVVGFASDGEGGENKDVLTIIETSTPSSNASENTKVNTISFSSDRTQTIKMIVRPTGCERMDSTGITSSGYTGQFYADIGDLQSPLACFTASKKSNITGGSRFGYRIHPITGKYKLHTGVDLSSNVGASLGTTVTAAADGEVIYVSNTCPHTNYGNSCGCGGGYGNYVIIQHSDTTKTLYAHLQQNVSVKAGQTVKAGDKIGTLGSSGSSTGPHLHFEVRYNNVPTDPLQYIN